MKDVSLAKVGRRNRKNSPLIQAKPEPPNTNTVWSCTFNPCTFSFYSEGTLLFVTISDILVVYNAENGDVVTKPTKAGNPFTYAAKDVVNCIAFSRDGKMFSTGSYP